MSLFPSFQSIGLFGPENTTAASEVEWYRAYQSVTRTTHDPAFPSYQAVSSKHGEHDSEIPKWLDPDLMDSVLGNTQFPAKGADYLLL